MLRKIELKGIAPDEEQQEVLILVLSESDGGRELYITIGHTEASMIFGAAEGQEFPVPIPCDQLIVLGKLLGYSLQEVVIDAMDGDRYCAFAVFQAGKKQSLLHLESRPSDIVYLALRTGVPMYAEERIFAESAAATLANSGETHIDQSRFQDWVQRSMDFGDLRDFTNGGGRA